MILRSVRARIILLSAASLIVGYGSVATGRTSAAAKQLSVAAQAGNERITPYHARVGRTRPVIAIVGENSRTELTDYVIPYGILRQADVGEVVPIATRPGPMTMRPAGVQSDNPTLLAWIREQAVKGSTLVSICDGALVVAGSGVMDGHRATALWATVDYSRKHYPKVRWVDNRRYGADGKIVSSVGISAAIPTSLALVEAIAGRERAATVAAEIGTPEWSSNHDSQRFHPKLGRNHSAFATTQYLNGWFHKPQALGIPVSMGVDEVALALTADAYTRTNRAHAYALGTSREPVETLHGLRLLPERTDARSLDRQVAVPTGKPGLALDRLLTDIARSYGRQTAYGVALDFEYPNFHG